MVEDAERYKQQDEQLRDSMAARNNLESYVFSLKQICEDDVVKDKLSEVEQNSLIQKVSFLIVLRHIYIYIYIVKL